MKELELANKIENGLRYQVEFGRRIADLEHDVPIAASELRRLAEVNAELMEVLSQSADLLDERCAGLGIYARSIVAKAKE